MTTISHTSFAKPYQTLTTKTGRRTDEVLVPDGFGEPIVEPRCSRISRGEIRAGESVRGIRGSGSAGRSG